MHHNLSLKKRKQKPVKSVNHFGHKFMSKIDLNTIKSIPHTFRNTTISQLMTTITKITHRKKKKLVNTSTAIPQTCFEPS